MLAESLDARLEIETPEQVVVLLPLGGAGSRMAAYGIDFLVRLALSIVILIPALFVSSNFPGLGDYVIAGALIAGFCLHFGYYIYYDLAHGGQTPGKKRMGLRIVKCNGAPLDLLSSILRNLLRVVDWLPAFYGVGLVSIFITSSEQRIGDLTAGTVVVREKPVNEDEETSVPDIDYEDICEELHLLLPARIKVHLEPLETEMLRRFLVRRENFEEEKREELAEHLVQLMRRKVVDPEGELVSYFENTEAWNYLLQFLWARAQRHTESHSGPGR